MNRFFLLRRPRPGQNTPQRIENAIVEEVAADNRGVGYILVSHEVRGANDLLFSERLRLNVSRNTRLRSANGRNVNLRDIKQGDRINATYSPLLTNSIPPQAAALEILLHNAPATGSTTTDRVVNVSPQGNFFIVGNPANINDQIRFNVTSATDIRDRAGRRIRPTDIRPGQLVSVDHSEVMTMSIPPQSTAFAVRIVK